MSDEIEHWILLAQVLSIFTLGFVILVFIWFLFINFLAEEEQQPLDFYSNKLRLRPPYIVFTFLAFTGIALSISITPRLGLMVHKLPELLIAAYLLGLLIGCNVLFFESAAACLVAMLAYAFVGPATALISMIPTLNARRPAVFYSGAFFVLNIVWVVWVGIGVRRIAQKHQMSSSLDLSFDDEDGEPKPDLLIPAGSERVPQIWAQVVCKWSPVLMIMTTMAYGVDYLLEEDEYGWACALAYFIIVFLLVFGCCRGFKYGTELQQ